MPQAGDIRMTLPLGHRVQVAVQADARAVSGQRDGHVDDPIVGVTVNRQAGVGKDLEHRRVLGQRLPGERGDLVAPGVEDQMLQQQGPDALVVHVVGDRESHLGSVVRLLRQRLVADAADHLTAHQRKQRHPARSWLPADPPRLGFGRRPAEAEEAKVGVIRRHRLVHGLDRVEVAGLCLADLHRAPIRQQRVHRPGLLHRAHVIAP